MKQIIWEVSESPIEYTSAILAMENYVQEMHLNNLPDKIWLLEHFDVFTKGTSCIDEDMVPKNHNIPIVNSNRGGKFTYHGLGQRIIYPMINLKNTRDISQYISDLQDWIIITLNDFNIDAFKKDGLIGVWIIDNNKEKKIAAIGVRVKKWIAYHGIAINVSSNLNNFKHIIPCGISNFGISSISALGKSVTYSQLDKKLKYNFNKVFYNDK